MRQREDRDMSANAPGRSGTLPERAIFRLALPPGATAKHAKDDGVTLLALRVRNTTIDLLDLSRERRAVAEVLDEAAMSLTGADRDQGPEAPSEQP